MNPPATYYTSFIICDPFQTTFSIPTCLCIDRACALISVLAIKIVARYQLYRLHSLPTSDHLVYQREQNPSVACNVVGRSTKPGLLMIPTRPGPNQLEDCTVEPAGSTFVLGWDGIFHVTRHTILLMH